jgi:hypothetical protein
MPESVICGTFLGVRQDSVRLGAFFELLFRVRVARILVRVMLHGQRAVSPFDLDLGGRAADAQYFVIISFRHTQTNKAPAQI